MTDQMNVEGLSHRPGGHGDHHLRGRQRGGRRGLAGLLRHEGIRSMLANKPSTSGIETKMGDDGKLSVAVHVEVYYGYVLPELAAQLRSAIAEALATQAGVEVSSVDVYIDGLQFKA